MLEDVTVSFIYDVFIIFARIGTILHFLPGFGDKFIFSRARLIIAIGVSILIQPMLADILPKAPIPPVIFAEYLIYEILIGALLGLTVRIMFLSLHTVSAVAAMQSGLGSASFFDITQKEQVNIFGGFVLTTGLMAIFVTNTHHIFIENAIDSYRVLPPREFHNIPDMSKYMSTVVNNSFILSFKIMSPFLIVSIAILAGGGILARLMPTLQVFFVITPVQILVTFVVFFIVFNSMLEYLITAVISAAQMH